MTFIVAIDGPSASGKGTIARLVAKELQWEYLNTGLLYRAVAYHAAEKQIDLHDHIALIPLMHTINFDDIDSLSLYSSKTSENASIIASIPEVRQSLLHIQRNFAIGKTGVIVEGRDIGTVIFPNADIKIYITASLTERAARRFKQLQSNDEDAIHGSVIEDIRRRDSRDCNRQNAPLMLASDCSVIDTTDISVAEATDVVLKLIRDAL